MGKNKKNMENIADLPVIYEVVEPTRFIRSCVHCSGHSCWCNIEFQGDNIETEK